MRTELETQPERTPVLRKAIAGLIVIIAAALAIQLVVGLIKAVLFTVAVVAVAIAVLWALKTIVW
jgi:hypothetical protein